MRLNFRPFPYRFSSIYGELGGIPGCWLQSSLGTEAGFSTWDSSRHKDLCRHLPANALERHLETSSCRKERVLKKSTTSIKMVIKRKVTLSFLFFLFYSKFLLVSSVAFNRLYQPHYVFWLFLKACNMPFTSSI